jgi:hypothetical protein
MLRLLFDENFNHDILRGVTLQLPDPELLTVQDAKRRKTPDPNLLAWAADEGRIMVTHDVNTMTKFAYDRVKAGEVMPGVFVVPDLMDIGDAIEQLVLLITCSDPSEWENRVLFLPM